MASRALVEKIEALPPAKRAEVEDFVDFLAARGEHPRPLPDRLTLLERLRTQRKRLLHEHGLYDSLSVLRELRDTGC